MLMKIEDFIKELKEIKLIAHRFGYNMTNYPENSFDAFKEVFKNKELLNSCDGFEFDICFTKDHEPILYHDKYIDDVTDSVGYIRNYTLEELKNINFSFRKSLYRNEKKDYKHNVLTLEEVLTFFQDNIKLLENKIIKIETKEAYKLNKNNMLKLATIINKFPSLKNNLFHLSYWPQNLLILKKIQKNNNLISIKNDLLCDYKLLVYISYLFKAIDNISLRIKTSALIDIDKSNTKTVNRKIFIDKLFMKFSNTIDEKLLKKVIKKYKSVGLFVLNDIKEIEVLCNKLSYEFIKESKDKLIITTDNPLKLKNKTFQ